MNHTMQVQNIGLTISKYITQIVVYNWKPINRVVNVRWDDTDFISPENVVAIFKIKWKK